jgi:hypothetical protein
MLFMFGPGTRRSVTGVVLTTLSIVSVLSSGVMTAAHGSVGAQFAKRARSLAVLAPQRQRAIRPVRMPPPAGRFDYQLGGSYPPPQGTQIVSRDRTDKPLTGAYNICYINAYQTQPGAISWWRKHYPDLLLRDKSGREIVDPNWPGEVLFDIRPKTKQIKLASVMYKWINGCARDGFDAVEPDNLVSWTRSHGLLHKANNVALAELLTRYSHKKGLAIAQKNTAELAAQGRSIGFDFAVAEECQVYKECEIYMKTYGRLVMEIEYTDNGKSAFAASCKARKGQISIVLRDRNLTLPGDADYALQSC